MAVPGFSFGLKLVLFDLFFVRVNLGFALQNKEADKIVLR